MPRKTKLNKLQSANPTYFIKTFGCQMNIADSERIATAYQSRGFIPVTSIKNANHIIINTCMVRQSAEDRVYGLVHNLSKAKEKNPKVKIIVTGCLTGMAIRDKSGKTLKKLKDRIPEVDEFLPIEEVGFDTVPLRSDKTNALIPISNGCNNFCTFCVVPYTRGGEVSRPFDEIIKECKKAIENGYTEITLVGQNVNSYGADLVKGKKRGYILPNGEKIKPVFVKHLGRTRIPTLFPYLLEEVSKLKGIKRVDFISSNPWDFSNELIEVIAKNKNISRQIHLPVQSGDDNVLKRMNRWYTADEYLNLVRKLRLKIKNLELSTDIIVGFPGETKEQFQNAVNLCKKAQFYKAYIAMYSDRPMTVAHQSFIDNVPYQEKKRRWKILDDLINKKAVKTPRRCTKYSSEVEGYQKLLIICGPTSSGKTALAVKLAKKFHGELISADSRQVYKEMDIISGKDLPGNANWTRFKKSLHSPTGELKIKNLSRAKSRDEKLQVKIQNYGVIKPYRFEKDIPIWLLDLVSPDEEFSVAHFLKYARIVIDDILKRKKLPIVVGGTGLYIKALIDGIETIGIPPNYRLRQELSNKTTEELQYSLKKFNPQRYSYMNNSDRNNPRRLIRAIEIEHFMTSHDHSNDMYQYSKLKVNTLQIGLTAPKKVLLEKIKKRVEKRIKSGAFDEVKQLIEKGYSRNLPSMSGDGYKELIQFYHGELDKKGAIEKWIQSDLEHAQKQIVWFKKALRLAQGKTKITKWIDITEKFWVSKLEKIVTDWYTHRN